MVEGTHPVATFSTVGHQATETRFRTRLGRLPVAYLWDTAAGHQERAFALQHDAYS